ncbi:DEAD/DEAH box helicase family protein [Streptomyces sp. NPDC048723]|uniref:DEAD/DEAH box helicase family protein n=1 Tax=Streptomyces sp. NPDC048723 TaxID=3365589 RepID=UPI003712B515
MLSRWSGWGAAPLIFEPRPAEPGPDADDAAFRAMGRWMELDPVRVQLRELMSDEQWAEARRNTVNAHYTDTGIGKSVWETVVRLGFDGGRVLEPGSGLGHYIGLAPTDTSLPIQVTGVEVEPATASLSRHLYPDSNIVTAGFEDVALEDGGFDLVVGNVPFGKYSRYDKVHNKDLSLRIHDHFILKSLAATRPGGIVAVITSRHTLDNLDTRPRERLYELGDLLGSVRLPYESHMAAADTNAVMDVLFLRRRLPGEQPGDDTWLQTRKLVLPGHEEEVRVNEYVLQHPEYVLGELRTRMNQFEPRPTVIGDRDAAEGLAEAGRRIAEAARAAGRLANPPSSEPAQAPAVVSASAFALTEGALGLDAEGNPTIVEDGQTVPLEVHAEQRERLVQLIGLKAKTLALYEAEAQTQEAGETLRLGGLRTALRQSYREYRKKYPALAKPRQSFIFTPKAAKERADALGLARVPDEWKARTAFAFVDDDPDASLLFGLETWDDRSKKATEQPVLHKRVLEPRVLPKHADTPEDAVALALEWDGGRLDMRRVASLLSVDEAEAQVLVDHLAFRDPAQGGFWEPRTRYLSGNVREKLRQAQAAAAQDPAYASNVSALQRVQPEDLTPAEIKARCGVPWIPTTDYRDFLIHLGFPNAEVRHAGGTVWEIRGADSGDLATKQWGTEYRSAQDLVLAIMRQADSTVQVTHRDKEGKTVVDAVATEAAREKARLLIQAFDDWIWADEARATRLAGIYNETFNNLVIADHDDGPLTLPGLVSTWRMRPHQNSAIRRMVSEPGALLDHVVGAGKTATMAGGSQELRRTGLIRKPLLVVPNHMLKQFGRDYRQLYPNAKLLSISATDLGRKKRAKFMARMASGDWDAVIMTHNAFDRVPLRPETQQAYLDTEMAFQAEQVEAARASGMQDRTVKDIETRLADAEARLRKKIEDSSNEPGVCLEDTGVDYVLLDEAHEYKNLRTISAIPGAGIQGSDKATKLDMVLHYLRSTQHERVSTMATGTPIANSVAEAHVFMRYLAPHLLEEQGVRAYDSWASVYGEVVSSLEPDAKGDGYKYKARFARFFNVPELMAAYRTFADVRTAEDLQLPLPTILAGPDGQRGETVHFPVTGSQRAFIKALPKQSWVREPGGVLKALGLGLRASLDMRLVGGEEDDGSKLESAAEKIVEIWRNTKDVVYPTSKDDPTPQPIPGGLQLVFCDDGTPGSGAENPVDLYSSLREHLVAAGMPREGIRFIHEASTDIKKEKLFGECRSGRVSVLIGSTKKMGTGTNIQDRSVALHHLSYPWRPADMAQRDGRLERQGNLNDPTVEGTPDHVRILYYVTQGSFDEFRLNTLARKARFIAQLKHRDFNLREIEDIGADALNLGMLAALSAEDPTLLRQAEATAERSRLQGLARTWDREQDSRARTVKDLDAYLPQAVTCLEGMRAALPKRRPTTADQFSITIDGQTLTSRDAAAAALGTRMVALARDLSFTPGTQKPVGTLGGCDFHGEITYNASGQRQLQLRFEWGNVVPFGHRNDRAQWLASSVTESNGRGAVTSLENLLNRLDKDAERLEREITNQQTNRAEAANNFRPYEDNPYRLAARSKEREEKLLGRLVIANEKIADLKERIGQAGERPAPADTDELEELSQNADELRALIADEHAVQEQATDPTAAAARGPLTSSQGAAADQKTTGTPVKRTPAGADPKRVRRPDPALPDPTAADSEQDREMTVEEMVRHDAQAMAHLLGDGAQVVTGEELAAILGGLSRGNTRADSEPSPPQDANSPAAEPPAPPAQPEPHLAPLVNAVFDEAAESTTTLLTSAGMADPLVTRWAVSDDPAPFTDRFEEWAQTWLMELANDPDADDLPIPVRFLLHRATREQGERIVAAAAAAVHAAARETAADDAAPPELTAPAPGMAQAAAETLGEAARTDPRVVAWARANDVDGFTLPFRRWADEWLLAQLNDLPNESWPDWARTYFSANRDKREELIRTVAETLHERLSQQADDSPAPEPGPERETDRPTTSEAPATSAKAAPRRGPQLEGIYETWLASDDWHAKAAAEGNDGEQIHLLATPHYVLIERGPGADYPWEVAPAATGQQLMAGPYAVTSFFEADARESAIALGGRLDRDLRAADGTYCPWPPVKGWRSADGHKLDRALAEARAAHDRALGKTDSPGIRHATILADRDTAATGPQPQQAPAPDPTEAGRPSTTSTDPERQAAVAEDMARCAAVLRYYEPLLHRHKVSGTKVADAITQPGYDPLTDADTILTTYARKLGKVGERLAGIYDRGFQRGSRRERAYDMYDVGEERSRVGQQLMAVATSLSFMSSGGDPFDIDLDAILAAPPGTVVELPAEAASAGEAPGILIKHTVDGTTVHGTDRSDEQTQAALKRTGFRWSRPQTMWYQRRDTPFAERTKAVESLREALESAGTPHTLDGERTAAAADPAASPPTEAAPTPQSEHPEPAADNGSAQVPAPRQDEAEARPEPTEQTPTPGTGAQTAPQAEAEPDDEQSQQLSPDEDLSVITPDGPGWLVSLQGGMALVQTAAGTKVYDSGDIYRHGAPDAPLLDPDAVAKRKQNEADEARAATGGGIPLRYPYRRRLRDLDVDAGHGTIAEGSTVTFDNDLVAPGEIVGWVRARTGDDGRRYWWAQDAAGGPPDDRPQPEGLPPKAGVPAIRVAGYVRTDMKPASMTGHNRPVSPPYAVREIKLTTAQVALLRTLPLTGTYPDGSELPTPPWVGDHRRYVMSVAQMQALRQAAEAAADTCDTTTTIGRRSRKVLLNAADRLHYEEYETARRGASIPPIGEPDPYAGPYTPPPPRPQPAEQTKPPEEGVLDREQQSAGDSQPAAPAEQLPAEEPIAQTEEAAVENQDQAARRSPTGDSRLTPPVSESPGQGGNSPTASAPRPAEPAPETEPPAAPAPATEVANDAPRTNPSDEPPRFAPQDRVFHDAMRYVVESVSPDGTRIRTITGQDIPVAEVVAEADMPPVITEDLAERWWRYTYEGRSYTASTLPPDLARTHPTALLNTVIVDVNGQLVGRAFGRPHESAIIWADAHPGVPHPHVAEWLDSAPTPWPDHTPAEIAHIAAGPPPPEADLSDEQPAPQPAVSGEPGEQSADRPTASAQPVTPSVPDTQETPAAESQPDGPQDPAGTDAGQEPGPDGINSRNDAEEYDMTVMPDTGTVAPDVEDPPEPKRYIETTALPMDPEFTLRLYGWDGQPPESGELLYRETAIAAVRPSQGGGWFARLSAEGLPADVTSLVATPFQAAHEGAVYFSALTAIPYGEPIPDAQPVGRLPRADVVRAAVRDAASMNRDLITAASARAWPTTYGSNPQLQHLVERLFEMQNALIDTAGARKMAADMEAVEQAAIALRGTLPEDPAAPERQHMGFRLAHLLYDTSRLQNHLRAALEATRAENEQQQAPSTDRDAAVEPAIALPDPPEPQPEPDMAPDPDPEMDPDLYEPAPEQYTRTTALDEDARFSLRMSGEVGQEPDYGEVLDGRAEFAIVRYSAAGGWYGQITDPAADFDVTPPVATPQEAAHHSAILYSIGYGAEYGEAPAPAQDTETATRAEVVRNEMADLAARHRDAITDAAARAWPTTHEQNPHLQAVTEALAGLAAAPYEALYVNQMEERLNAVDAAAMTWVSYLPAVPGPERQHMMFPLSYLARDARRLEARLQATAAAVREEREALRQAAGPEPEPAAAPVAEAVQAEQPPRATVVITLPTDPYYRLHLSGPAGQEYDHGELIAGEEGVADVRRTTDGWYGRLGDFDMAPDITTSSATPEEAAHKAAILASGLTGRPYGAPAEAAQDTALSTRAETLRDEMRAIATHHRAEISAAAFRAWPAGSDEAAVQLDELNRRLNAMTAAVDQRPSAREMTAQLDDAREAASQVFDWLGTLADNEAVRRHMAFPLAHLLYDSGRLYWRVEATAAAVQAERAEVADQQRSTEVSEPVPTAPDQDLGVSGPPELIPPQPIPAVPDPAPELPVAVGDRPEAEAEQATAPSTEDPAESVASPSAVEDISTIPVPAGCEQEAVVPEQPEADLPRVGEPAPAEPAVEATPDADIPLWAGPDPDDVTSYEPDAADSDLLSDLSVLQEAVAVLASGGVPHDFREALHDELSALEQALDGPVTVQPADAAAAAEENAPPGDSLGDGTPGTFPRQDAAAVNRALAAADQHQAALHATPEWQEIQTVRGAARNLWEAIKRQTGVHFEQLMGDGRVQAWWKKTSIRICERIANLATRAADRLRGHSPEPAACMDRLHEAADRYGWPAVPPRGDESELQKRMRKLGDGLAASQVKVNVARARSTTVRKPPKPRGAPADQPGHLRRTAADPKRGPRQGR